MLTLVLTLAMLLSVMVVGAGAAVFDDQDSIKNTEAVNTCNALNIINGENGSFYPTRNVTRAEMCKMICVALNGGREPALATGIGNTFTDTVGHWASPYIEYCVREGVVGGIGGGLFDPNGAVTGTQAAKMLLVAMGYNASRQGYVGSNAWELNINGDAAKNGLYDGLETIDASAPLNRDNAAQIIYNALEATMVEYIYSAQTVNGTLTMVPSLKDKTYFDNGTEIKDNILHAKYGVYSNYGQLVEIDGNELSIDHDSSYDSQTTGLKTQVNFSKITTDYTDLLGQTVKVLYKNADEVLGVGVVDGNKTYTVPMSSVEAKGTGLDAKVKFGGTEYKVENDTSKGNIDVITINASGVSAVADETVATLTAGAASSYDTVTFVDNDNDGTLEYAIVTEVITGKVTYTNNDEIMVKGVTDSYKRADNEIASGVAKDEYVTVIYNPFTEKNVIDVIAKGTGKLSVNSDGDCMFSGDSTWYKVGPTGLTSTNAGTSYDYWAYNGVLVDKDNAKNDASIDNLVVVLNKTGAGVLTNQARIMFTDGTKQNVDVVGNDYADDDVNFSALNAGTMYLATETSEGWTFEAIVAGDEIGDYTFVAGKAGDVKVVGGAGDDSANVKGNIGDANTPISDDAVVFVCGDGTNVIDGKILTGKEFKTLDTKTDGDDISTQSNGFFTSTANGLTRATIVAVKLAGNATSLPDGDVKGDNYGLIVGDLTKVDSKTISYTVWDGEKNIPVTEEKNSLDNRAQFTVITYDAITDGVITGVQNQSAAATGLWSVESDKVWTDNDTSLKLTGDTVYMAYDSNTTTAANVGKTGGKDLLKAADKAVDGADDRIPNVRIIMDSTGKEVDFILIDVGNRIKDTDVTVTAAVSGSLGEGVTATLSPVADIKYGDVLTLTITVAKDKTLAAGSIALTGAVTAEGGNASITISEPIAGGSEESGKTVDYKIVATASAVSAAYTAS